MNTNTIMCFLPTRTSSFKFEVSLVLLTLLFAFCKSSFQPNEYCEKEETCAQGDSLQAGDPSVVVNLTTIVAGEIDESVPFEDPVSKKDLKIRTLALNPNVFEIRNFLSVEECNHLIQLAKDAGLQSSNTQNAEEDKRRVRPVDLDRNFELTLTEMIITLEQSLDIYFDEGDALKMYKDLQMDKNNDGIIERHELNLMKPAVVLEYVRKITKQNPTKQSRFSEQAWIFPSKSDDTIFKAIQERVQSLTQLPSVLIKKSDFQVVHYGPRGHYHAHIDSSRLNEKLPCCTREQPSRTRCRTCRFMTVLFYLNDVQEGGGTAFPVADNATFHEKDLWTSQKVNLNKHCLDANLVVQPERGKALMWYNHKVDPSTGWMGEVDMMTWHGGCPVLHGEKWIANFWIKTTDNRESDLEPLP